MITSIEFVILSLAVWRISALLTYEFGPANVFGRLRGWVEFVDGKQPTTPGSLTQLANCPLCMSLWVSLFAFAVFAWQPVLTLAVSIPLALSGLSSIIERHLGQSGSQEPEEPQGPPPMFDDFT